VDIDGQPLRGPLGAVVNRFRPFYAPEDGIVLDYPTKPTLLRDNPTYRLYKGSDGQWFFVACGNQSFWVKLCTALGMEEFAHDPRFTVVIGIKPRQLPTQPWCDRFEALLHGHDPRYPVSSIILLVCDSSPDPFVLRRH